MSINQWTLTGTFSWWAGGLGETELGFIITLNNAQSGGFIVAGTPGVLRIRADDGTTRPVQLQGAGPLAAGIGFSNPSPTVGPTDVTVELQVIGVSTAPADGIIELLDVGAVAASLSFTSVTAPEIQFEGRFQCRLATDSDGFDHPWGVASSFGMYAVQGPDPANPYEPPLDRIVRFQQSVALRPLCPPVGVFVKRIRGRLASGSVVTFDTGDPVLGQPVRLGPACKFDAQDGNVAPPGFEPISDFEIHVGSTFSGASESGLPRTDPSVPPPSKAPYADGFFRMITSTDLGYPDVNWTVRAVAVTTQKIADLNSQVATSPAEVAIRARRIMEHTNNLSGIRFTLRMLERYTGVIDRNLAINPDTSPVLLAFQNFTAFRFYAEFFDFDSDCQCGTVWGTIGPV